MWSLSEKNRSLWIPPKTYAPTAGKGNRSYLNKFIKALHYHKML